jgi:Arc/MetJ-type ribon-helix-helix transcriptional regulator
MTLSAKTKKLIERHMKQGGYASADDVMLAALASLEQQENLGDFARGELEGLLEAGEKSGKPLDGDKVLAEFRNLRKHSRKAG